MYDLFSLATQKEYFEEDLKHNPPLKPNSEYDLIILPEKIYSLISNISLKSMDNYFSAKFYMKKLNEGLDYILTLGYDFERDIEIAGQNKRTDTEKILAGIHRNEIVRKYEGKTKNIFYDIKDDNSKIVREGLYSIATRFYVDIFFSLACLQKDACNIGIELDINKNGKKYFDPDFLKYFETEEAVQVFTNSKAMGFSHAALIQAYIENPNDILNTAEELAKQESK